MMHRHNKNTQKQKKCEQLTAAAAVAGLSESHLTSVDLWVTGAGIGEQAPSTGGWRSWHSELSQRE